MTGGWTQLVASTAPARPAVPVVAAEPPPPRPRSRRARWTEREDRVIAERFAQGGARAVAEVLNWRSLKSIYERAMQLGHRSQRQAPHARPVRTRPEWDAAIRALCLQPRRARRQGDVRRLAEHIGVCPGWVYQRARRMGLVMPRNREPDWTEAEARILRESQHLTVPAIRQRLAKAGFKRTITAVAVKMKRLALQSSLLDGDEWLTTETFSAAMGVDPKAVQRWIVRDGLPHKRVQSRYRIPAKRLRRWFATHAQLVDLCKVDRYWFIDLACGSALRAHRATGGGLGIEFESAVEDAEISGRSLCDDDDEDADEVPE